MKENTRVVGFSGVDGAGKSSQVKELISYFDVMVDGEFQIEHKDLGLAFKGSSNQRTIMVQESLQKGRLCIWQPQ